MFILAHPMHPNSHVTGGQEMPFGVKVAHSSRPVVPSVWSPDTSTIVSRELIMDVQTGVGGFLPTLVLLNQTLSYV